MKKVIFWEDKITGESGHGEPTEAAPADTWVEMWNKRYPNIKHIAVDVDKLAGEASE